MIGAFTGTWGVSLAGGGQRALTVEKRDCFCTNGVRKLGGGGGAMHSHVAYNKKKIFFQLGN